MIKLVASAVWVDGRFVGCYDRECRGTLAFCLTSPQTAASFLLTRAQIESIQTLLSQGASHRRIARALGFSRATVCQVASGVESDRARADGCLTFRCPGCGRLVFVSPCPACLANAYREAHREARP